MNRVKKVLIFVGLIFVVSCNYKSNEKEGFQKDYLKILDSYPRNLTSHFPNEDNIKVNYISYISYPSKYSPSQLIVKQSESKSTIDSLISASTYIPSTDSSYYIVNKYLRKDNVLSLSERNNELSAQRFYKEAIPIPNFYDTDEFREDTFHHLKNSYSIYLVNAEPEKCCADELHKGNWQMPTEWQDGHSKGYAIDTKNDMVIYWLVIW